MLRVAVDEHTDAHRDRDDQQVSHAVVLPVERTRGPR
jgi:hypothetical protein